MTANWGSTRQWRKLRLPILERDRHVCHWCGAFANCVDHVKPRVEGGTDHPSNLVASCRTCNSRRAAQWVNANHPGAWGKHRDEEHRRKMRGMTGRKGEAGFLVEASPNRAQLSNKT